jgi:hypothetical protein
MQGTLSKACKNLLAASLFALPAMNSAALGPQTFLGLNYSNPAALNSIHQAEFILGRHLCRRRRFDQQQH